MLNLLLVAASCFAAVASPMSEVRSPEVMSPKSEVPSPEVYAARKSEVSSPEVHLPFTIHHRPSLLYTLHSLL